MVFEIINWNWWNIMLKVHCLHCCDIPATIICRIVRYNWLSSSEYSNNSQIKLLTPEWVFCKEASKGRVWIHCNGYSTYGCVVENIFLNELVLSCRNDLSLCQLPMFPCCCSQLEHKLVETFYYFDSVLWASSAECTENSPQNPS